MVFTKVFKLKLHVLKIRMGSQHRFRPLRGLELVMRTAGQGTWIYGNGSASSINTGKKLVLSVGPSCAQCTPWLNFADVDIESLVVRTLAIAIIDVVVSLCIQCGRL